MSGGQQDLIHSGQNMKRCCSRGGDMKVYGVILEYQIDDLPHLTSEFNLIWAVGVQLLYGLMQIHAHRTSGREIMRGNRFGWVLLFKPIRKGKRFRDNGRRTGFRPELDMPVWVIHQQKIRLIETVYLSRTHIGISIQKDQFDWAA
jgi:hypothetical protein